MRRLSRPLLRFRRNSPIRPAAAAAAPPPPRHGIPYGADLQAAPGEGALSRPKTRVGDARAKRHRICVCLDRKGRAPAVACGDCRPGARRLRGPSAKSRRGRQSGSDYSWLPASDSVAAFSMLPPRRRLRRSFGGSSAIRPVPALRQYMGCSPACIAPAAIACGWRCAVPDIRVACPVGRPRGGGQAIAARFGSDSSGWLGEKNGAGKEGDRGGRRNGGTRRAESLARLAAGRAIVAGGAPASRTECAASCPALPCRGGGGSPGALSLAAVRGRLRVHDFAAKLDRAPPGALRVLFYGVGARSQNPFTATLTRK